MYGDVVLGVDHHHFEEILEHAQGRPRRRRSTPSSTADDWQTRGRRLQGHGRSRDSASRSRRTRTSSSGARSARCSARWMNQRADHLSPAARHPRATGAPPSTCRRWCSATWATTAPPASPSPATPRPARTTFYGEYLVNAQGEDVVAGIRTPQHLTHRRQEGQQLDAAGDGRGDARGLRRARRGAPQARRRTTATCRTSSSRSQQRQALDAADPQRQAHRRGGAQDRRSTWSRERLIDRERGGAARRAGVARPAAASDARSQGASARCSRAACRPRPAPPSGKVVFTADEAEDARQQGRDGHPGAHRDQPRGHPRHARRPGHPHHARRHDQPRGRRRARHGPALRRRRRRAAHRLRRRGTMTVRDHGHQGRRAHHHRRRDRRGDARRGADDPAGAVGRLRAR